ncbi:non-ribosomal peptide synthetase, partial [Fulvivirga kasyanovii]
MDTINIEPTVQFPLSEGQEALWIAQQMNPGTHAYNIPLVYWLADTTDLKVLENSFQEVVKKHNLLAARIQIDQGRPVHMLNGDEKVFFTVVDAKNESDASLIDRIRKESKEPFDLENESLLRVKVYKRVDNRYALLILVHHLVFDGASVAILLEDLLTSYYAQKGLDTPESTSSAPGFSQFVEWQQDMLNGQEGKRLAKFWTEQAFDQLDPKILPTGSSSGANNRSAGALYSVKINQALAQEMRELTRSKGQTSFALMLSVYYILLYRYSGLTSMAVGIPMIGRPGMKFERTIGCFINMVALRCDLSEDLTFSALLKQVSDNIFDAYDHSHYPLYTFKKALKANHRSTDLFSTAFYYQKIEELKVNDQEGILGERIESLRQVGEFDLTMEVVEYPDSTFEVFFKYDTNQYDEDLIKQFSNHFISLLESSLREPDSPIQSIGFDTVEKEMISNADMNVPQVKTLPSVVDLIRDQASKRPDDVAVVFGNNSLTYHELLERSDRVAKYLIAGGISGAHIGMFVDRTENLLPVLIGILASGNAFVPLDPMYPKERLVHMLEDGGVPLVITDDNLKTRLPEGKHNFITYEEILQAKGSQADLPTDIQGDSPAYIIFTSGSTGKPKGVVISHNSLSNFLLSMQKRPGISETDRLLAVTTVCFDIAYLELFLPLIAGAAVEIASSVTTKDGILLKERLDSGDITIMQATPSTWRMILAAEWEGCDKLNLLCGGEALSAELAKSLIERCRSLWNMYGPTEATIWASVAKVDADATINLGEPVDNMDMMVLQEDGASCAVGVPGEVYISGVGLAIGYLNRPVESAERFVERKVGGVKKRLYKTGDLGRYIESGHIEYLGRIDQQVKFNGHRIELGEIELALQKIEGIADAVVVKREERLVAFLKKDYPNKEISETELKNSLKLTLPEYMVPTLYHWINAYPLTLNNKVDRKALVEKSLSDLSIVTDDRREVPQEKQNTKYTPEQEQIERELIQIIAEEQSLDVNQVGKDRNIGDFGFDSIGYTALGVKISKKFNKKITPATFFEHQTIAAIASHIVSGDRGNNPQNNITRSQSESSHKRKQESLANEPIAIIGMGGKYPQADNLQEFWEKLEANENLITEIPVNRWDWRKYQGDVHKEQNKTNSKWGGFIKNLDKFDASFFGISPREAELMDPLQRIMLEMTWNTFEDAGYKPADFSGSNTGVFIGCVSSDYTELILNSGCEIAPHTVSGMAKTMIANRLSFILNLKGPSVVVDTACSSSLVAVHQALESIRHGHCDVAFAGGVNIMLSPFGHIALAKNEMLSPDGLCKAFDASANGYVRGEGAGLIMLKRLSEAERDGDYIYGVIRGSAENHGGRTNSLTAPNPNAQADLIINAIEQAQIDPATISYMEAHGTGTALGDPIEVNGLKQAFQRLQESTGNNEAAVAHCGIGSVKTNVGHLEGAAGIVGLQRVILSMKNQKITANVHLNQVNPHIDLADSPFYIVEGTRDWTRLKDEAGDEVPRRAGVSSFGFGGVNAHILLEEYIDSKEIQANSITGQYLIVLSAKDKDQLSRRASQLKTYLQQEGSDHTLADIAFTLQKGREAMEERVAFVVEDINSTIQKLTAIVENKSDEDIFTGSLKKLSVDNGLIEDLTEIDDFQDILLTRLMSKGDIRSLARLWARGVDIEFEELYDRKPNRIPLPAYPFKQVRHWISVANKNPLIDGLVPNDELHTHVFEKLLSNQQDVVKDHVVAGKCIFPGVGYLEMAYEAASQLKKGPFSISNVYWLKPLIIDEDVKVNVVLKLNQEHYDFEVLSAEGELHTSGRLQLSSNTSQEYIALEALQQPRHEISFEKFYQSMQEKGVFYGPYYSVIKSFWITGDEALGLINVDEAFAHELDDYHLSPALMDGVLQTTATLMMHLEAEKGLKVPFSVGQVEFMAKPQSVCYAYAIKSKDGKYHGAILNQKGEVCIKVHDVINRELDNSEVAQSNYYNLQWKRVSLEVNKPDNDGQRLNTLYIHSSDNEELAKELAKVISDSKVSFLSVDEIVNAKADNGLYGITGMSKVLEEQGRIDRIIYLGGLQTTPLHPEDTTQGVLHAEQSVRGLFRIFKFLLERKQLEGPLSVFVLTNDTCSVIGSEKIQPFSGGLLGMAQTLDKEYPEVSIRLLDLSLADSDISSAGIQIKQLMPQMKELPVLLALRGGQVYRKELHPIHLPAAGVDRFESGKVYLIIGGSGGLGRVLSDHITDKHQIKLIWVGRSALGEEQEALRSRIESKGSELTYIRGDIGDPKRCEEVFRQAKSAYGVIHGVVHSALELRDKRLE